MQQHGDTLELATAAPSTPYVERFLGTPGVQRLSKGALEVLAVVAYHQPVTRAVVESMRGVNSDRAIATLLQRGLIQEVGRLDAPGRPVLLRTAPEFLRYLALGSLGELPPLDTTQG